MSGSLGGSRPAAPAAVRTTSATLTPTAGPVTRRPGAHPAWVVTRYRDVVRVLRDHEHFSSEYGNLLRLRDDRDPAAGRMVTLTDPPAHSALRAIMNRAISERSVAELRSLVRRAVDQLLGAAVEAGTVDFVHTVADPLPVEVTCELLGVPGADRPRLAALSAAAFAEPDDAAAPSAEGVLAGAELVEYFVELAYERRARPGSDVLSRIVHAELDGAAIPVPTVALNCYSLLLGGLETSRAVAAGGLALLADRPADLARLRADPRVSGTAVEEMVRWICPVRQLLRRCTTGTEVDGHRIDAGAVVEVWLSAANRDGEVFADPEVFDIARTPNPHLGFGTGDHRCVGRGTARLELRELFTALAAAPVDVTLAGPAVLARSSHVARYLSLPVRFTRH